MDVVLPMPGTYIVAVSGGVDSRVLLDILYKQTKPDTHSYIVAHLDHGIRDDSSLDHSFVKQLAKNYQLPFEAKKVALGNSASEERARIERYTFLQDVQRAHNASAVITAHHQDDVLETAILNMLRGTGRKGLTSLQSSDQLLRPFLAVPKSELTAYAIKNNLKWREDSTNSDDMYLRNYVRNNLIPRIDTDSKEQLIALLRNLRLTNKELDTLLVNQIVEQGQSGTLNRQWFNSLPHAVAKEMMASWLRLHNVRDFDSKTIERLVVAAKSGRYGQVFPTHGKSVMRVGKENLALELAER